MKRNRIKAILSATLVLAMCFTLLAGCKGNASSASTSSGSGQITSPVTITYLTTETPGTPEYDQFMDYMNEYKKVQPNVTVNLDAQPSAQLRTKISVQYAAGNPPDMSWCILSYARNFMSSNLIMDWKPVMNDPKNADLKNTFSAPVLSFSDFNGKWTMCPKEASMDGLYYNPAIFEKYNWELPKSFDDMVTLAGKAKAQGITLMTTGGKDLRWAWLASMLLIRAGGTANADALALKGNDWTDPKYGFVDAMTKFKQLVDAGAFPKNVNGISQAESDQLFCTGKAAMDYEGAFKFSNWMGIGGKAFTNTVKRMEFPPMTDMKNGDAKANVGGPITGYVIANKIPQANKDAAIATIKYLSLPKFFVRVMNNGGYLVPTSECDYDTSLSPKGFQATYDAFKNATKFVPSMDAYAAPAVDLCIKTTAMPGIISGEYTVAQACQKVQDAQKAATASASSSK